MLKIDKNSLKNICGNSNALVVYGFGKYNYQEITESLLEEKYTVQNWLTWPLRAE